MTTPQSGHVLSHYRLVEKIGEGGMGVVWKAEDSLLGRVVAIKVLPADFDRDERRRQLFLQEARLASSLSEAHIAQIYDFGREQDIDFIVMEFVDGRPLSRILHGRPLPPERVAFLGRQMAEALSRAHRKGLLHRDLKPGNMLVTSDDEVKIVDFGLAMLFENRDRSFLSETISQAPTASLEKALPAGTLSRSGDTREPGLVGTLPYMSPEQARGERLDARSDIFSLGAVLYEMATGQRPFSGSTNAATLREVIKARPRLPHEISSKLPLDLERIIVKALAPQKSERYQTMDDLAVDLKRLDRELESGSSPSFDDISRAHRGWLSRTWIWTLVGALAAGALAIGAWRLNVAGGDESSRTILILPMTVAGQAEGASYTGRAFAEAIAINLAQSQELTVLPVAAEADIAATGPLQGAAAAAKLGAGRLLMGSLTREGGSLHISLSLVDTKRNRMLWGTQKDESDGSLSRLAASLSGTIAAALGATPRRRYEYPLNITGSPAMAASPVTAEAVGALRRYEAQRALDLTETLIGEFPGEPDALALRAYALLHALGASGASSTNTPEGRRLLEQSLAALDRADPGNALGEIMRCEILGTDARWEDLIPRASTVLSRDDLTPAARAWALRNRSGARNFLGQRAAALEDIKEASILDPTNHYNFQVIGLVRESADDLDGAAIAFRQCNALAPEFANCYLYLSRVLEKADRWTEAVKPAARCCDLNKTRGICAAYAYSLIRAGRRLEARTTAEQAATLPGDDGGEFNLARTWAALGDRDRSLRLLGIAARPHSPDMATIQENPYMLRDADFEPFQAEPEFRKNLAAIRRALPAPGGR